MKDLIKDVVANILYLDVRDINDDAALFVELNLSSIDYIDLCFELKQKTGINTDPDVLWPLNKMSLDGDLYQNGQWTDLGWKQVCGIIGCSTDIAPQALKQLYGYFSVDYINNRLQALK